MTTPAWPKAEDWQNCTEIFNAAVELPAQERATFLQQRCAENELLRRKVELLLKCHDKSGTFIEAPAFEVVPELLLDNVDALVGQHLGHYRIESVLGIGGMGVVYLARDEALGRNVGLKLLPQSLVANPVQLQALKREARTASALNHPNIVTIHEIGEANRTHYIATEFIEGITLRERMAQGPIPPNESLAIALQIANALSVAHAAGIVHRDIKPENIMLRPDGYVKVLDFGIAKFTQPEMQAADSLATREGIISGTTRYMSPEQMRGEMVDARTDIWSLGVTLYEMLAGHEPFAGETPSDVIAAVLQTEPPLPGRLSPEVHRVIRRALAKKSEERYQNAAELRADLEKMQRQRSFAGGRWRLAAGLVALLLAGVGYVTFSPRSSEIKSLAVLPLENLSGDPAQEYFVDGVTDALIGDLAQIGALRVISRTSSMHYKGTKKSLPEIAQELKVDAIVEGTVQRSEGRVQIRAQLIHAATDRHLWAQTYERDSQHVLNLQGEIAQAIAREVRAKITPNERARVTAQRSVRPKALENYLQGRYLAWNKRTEENLNKAIEHFQSAIKEDPTYPLPYVGLADCYNGLGSVQFAVLPPMEARKRAADSAAKALELDSELAEAHSALGYAHHYNWNWTAAEQEFKRALELNPNYANAHSSYASYLMSRERTAEVFAASDRARELDPLSIGISIHRGFLLFLAHRYDEAIAQLEGILAIDQNHYQAYWFLGHTFAAAGRLSEAVAAAEKAVAIGGRNPGSLGVLGMVYGLAGRKDEATQVLNELLQLNEQRYVTPTSIAHVYLGLGDKDQMFAWLEKSYQERSNFIAYLKVYPLLDSYHSDPRFVDLVRRVGLPQ